MSNQIVTIHASEVGSSVVNEISDVIDGQAESFLMIGRTSDGERVEIYFEK